MDLATWLDRPPFADQVARLAAYRGVTRLGGLTLAAEVGDWRRFARAAQFMGFCGLVPSEDSSGHSVHRGRLTKAGNAHLRAQLAWVGLDLPASTVCGPRDCRPPARAGPRGDRPRSCACPLGSAPWPPARTPNPSWPPRAPANWPGSCGRDGGLTPPPPQGCAPSLLIGRGGEHHRYDAPGRRRCRTDPRRHDAAASPKRNWSGAPSCVLPTCGPGREYQCGGQPIHCVPARRARPRAARSPPPAREVNPYACSCASACTPRCGSTMPSTRGTIALTGRFISVPRQATFALFTISPRRRSCA